MTLHSQDGIATLICSRCRSVIEISVPYPLHVSLVISVWATEYGALCAECLKIERGDMNQLATLLAAIIMVESGGNDFAIGSDHKSYGPLQITDICRQDVNRIAHAHYEREDCFVREKAVEMFHVYVEHYCTRDRLGRDPRWEDAARIWNGGPDGWEEPATIPYWEKVRDELHNANLTGSLKPRKV